MTDNDDYSDYLAGNRALWDIQAADYIEAGERNWATDEVRWGVFGVPETQLQLLPHDLQGKDAIELGCGTAYVSAWLAKRGANPVGIDNSPKQLETARRLQHEHDIEFPLHLGNAEVTPFADESFDYAISEYGATIWCDPYKWLPEAARLLRPGGELMFYGNSVQLMLSSPVDDEDAPVTTQLERPLFGMYRFDWNDHSTEFHISHGERIRLLRDCGFEILDLVEVQPPDGSTTRYPWIDLEWARRWPCEEAWRVRKRG